MKRKQKHKLNWRPDLPDFRDHLFTVTAPRVLPIKSDLRPACPPVVNQGQIGSCTANALSGAFGFLELKELKSKSGSAIFSPAAYVPASRLFIYYNERALEGTVNQDAGARIRDGVKVLNSIGVCSETIWKYQSTAVFKKPSAPAFKEAAKHQVTEYLRLANLQEMKACLADGFPFVFGFSVYESFESPAMAKTGVMPMPRADEKLLGGHAVMAVGYDDSAQCLIVRNSWGTEWGMAGYFVMPYAYVANLRLAQDFWTIRK